MCEIRKPVKKTFLTAQILVDSITLHGNKKKNWENSFRLSALPQNPGIK